MFQTLGVSICCGLPNPDWIPTARFNDNSFEAEPSDPVKSRYEGVTLLSKSIRDNVLHNRAMEELRASEMRYRRLFETAQDGILIVDFTTGRIEDVNKFLIDLLGYSHDELVGKKLWEIGPVQDIAVSQGAFAELRSKGTARYEDLPLQTKDSRDIEVEFVSNVYTVNGKLVIQCNIRDITQRKQCEAALLRSEEQLHQSYKLEAVG